MGHVLPILLLSPTHAKPPTISDHMSSKRDISIPEQTEFTCWRALNRRPKKCCTPPAAQKLERKIEASGEQLGAKSEHRGDAPAVAACET